MWQADRQTVDPHNSLQESFVRALLADQRPTYGSTNAYGVQAGSFMLTVTEASNTVPEPESLALVGLGLAGLLLVSRRRKKALG